MQYVVAKSIFIGGQYIHGHSLPPDSIVVTSPDNLRGHTFTEDDTFIWLTPPSQGMQVAVELGTLDPDRLPRHVHRYQGPLTFHPAKKA